VPPAIATETPEPVRRLIHDGPAQEGTRIGHLLARPASPTAGRRRPHNIVGEVSVATDQPRNSPQVIALVEPDLLEVVPDVVHQTSRRWDPTEGSTEGSRTMCHCRAELMRKLSWS
jgi:hypothetical protein